MTCLEANRTFRSPLLHLPVPRFSIWSCRSNGCGSKTEKGARAYPGLRKAFFSKLIDMTDGKREKKSYRPRSFRKFLWDLRSVSLHYRPGLNHAHSYSRSFQEAKNTKPTMFISAIVYSILDGIFALKPTHLDGNSPSWSPNWPFGRDPKSLLRRVCSIETSRCLVDYNLLNPPQL